MSSRRARHTLAVCGLLVGALLFALTAAELVLRSVSRDVYYVWPPRIHYRFNPSSGVMPGVTGMAHFDTNAHGVRGDEFCDDQRYRILCIGGSTTECAYLDQVETWPHLLEFRLNHRPGISGIWVGNVGKAGMRACNHLVQVPRLLDQFPRIDAVLLLVGINDLLARLQDDHWSPIQASAPETPELLASSFSVHPVADGDAPFLERMALWRLLARTERGPPRGFRQDEAGDIYTTLRQLRSKARSYLSSLPDLTDSLADYAETLRAIVDVGRQRRVRMILITQPALWRPNLPPAVNDLLWMGGTGDYTHAPGQDYYSPEALGEGLQRYNDVLRNVCTERGCECVDLAALLPRDLTVFYDDCHFNQTGAVKVAKLLEDHLCRSDPFNGMPDHER